MPKANIYCEYPHCGQSFPNVTLYRQHYGNKHKAIYEQPEFQPSRQSQPTPTIPALNSIPKDAPVVQYPSRMAKIPQFYRPTANSDSHMATGPEHVDSSRDNSPFHLDNTPPVFDSNATATQRPSIASRLPWFDPSKYNKIVTADGLTQYVHRTAGRVLRKETTVWEKLLAKRQKAHPNAPWHPFASEAEWRLAFWLTTCKASQSKINEFLDMNEILAETPSFGRANQLFQTIENDLNGFGGPEWFCQQILPEDFPDGKHEDLVLYLRNLEECLDYLAGRPDLNGYITFSPGLRFAGEDEIEVYDEMTTGHLWHQILRDAGQHPDAALGGVLFGSDKTHLTNYSGDIQAHALYVSLGNIDKSIRGQTSKRAWMLIAYIPICKWENTLEQVNPQTKSEKNLLPGILSRRLFHFCMEIICEPLREFETHEITDPQGNIRLIFYVLVAYLADLEEQYMIAALDKSNCVHCVATTKDFGSPDPLPPRTSQSILEAIARVQKERNNNTSPYQFSLGAGKERLGDVEYPFWAGLPFVDICQSLSVDLLHTFHKYFWDHPFQWNAHSIGDSEIDARMKAQVPYSGGRTFPRGVTHISQMSGKEHRALQKVHLSIVANSGAKYSRELTLVTRALLDYIYYAQLPFHTEHTLQAFLAAYDEFHRLKDVWIKNEARRGEKTIMTHFNIPKLHAGRHILEQIRAKGAADNFSTEVIEHMHMDTVKEAYPATNKKDWEKQTLRWLTRGEKLAECRLFHAWRKSTHPTPDTPAQLAVSDTGPVGCSDRTEPVPQPDEAPAARRFKRGGFVPESAAEDQNILAVRPPATKTKKRARQIDDLDDKEERAAKRVERAQQTYALSEHQDATLRPTETLTIAAVQQKYGLPTLLEDCRASDLIPTSISGETVVGVWTSIRLTEPSRPMFPKVEWTRANASPPVDDSLAVADPVLYLREGVEAGRPNHSRLQDCNVGRLRLVFAIIPVTPQPSMRIPVFAYLHSYRSIPLAPENATNMFVVTKPARIQTTLINVARVIRICPLAPHISGAALPGVTPNTTLERYSSFYINKYHSIGDFVWLNDLHGQ
ncbi:beige protein [Ceratobasidium sp. AG-Ba]|nr:beige protein [Ceratobasidium sp. AG-Ba]